MYYEMSVFTEPIRKHGCVCSKDSNGRDSNGNFNYIPNILWFDLYALRWVCRTRMTLFINLLQDFIDVALFSSIDAHCTLTQLVSVWACVWLIYILYDWLSFISIHINWPSLAREKITDNRIFVAFVCVVTACIHGFDFHSFSPMCAFL